MFWIIFQRIGIVHYQGSEAGKEQVACCSISGTFTAGCIIWDAALLRTKLMETTNALDTDSMIVA